MREITDRHPKTRELRKPIHCIKQWREKRGWSCMQLGERCGLSASMISQLEVGRARLTETSLEAIAKGLGIEPWQLLLPPERAVVLGDLVSMPTMEQVFQHCKDAIREGVAEHFGRRTASRTRRPARSA